MCQRLYLIGWKNQPISLHRMGAVSGCAHNLCNTNVWSGTDTVHHCCIRAAASPYNIVATLPGNTANVGPLLVGLSREWSMAGGP